MDRRVAPARRRIILPVRLQLPFQVHHQIPATRKSPGERVGRIFGVGRIGSAHVQNRYLEQLLGGERARGPLVLPPGAYAARVTPGTRHPVGDCRHMRLAAALPAALLLCGCAASPSGSFAQFRQPPEGLQLTAQPAATTAGAVSTLTLYNGAAEPVAQNLCFAALERLGGGLWVPAVSVAKGCPEVFAPLDPGQQATAQSPLPPALESGTYRFVTTMFAPPGSVPPKQLRSDRFTVAGADGE